MKERECSETKYYFDNSATTRVSDAVLEAMLPFFQECYGNASSIYTLGRNAREAYIMAARQTAEALGAEESEIYFTSGGSESDNWALKSGAAFIAESGKRHIISSEFEHPAVLNTLKRLESQGFGVSLVKPDRNGIIEIDELRRMMRPDTGLVSIMSVNNETGMIQPIGQIGRLCRDAGILFHTDAVQAVGNIEIDVRRQNIDLLSASGHKIHGPKGIGILYMRKGLWLDPLIDGGGQEKGRRGGTENIPGIVGIGAAMKEAVENMDQKQRRLRRFQKKMLLEFERIPDCELVGTLADRVCTNLNLCVKGVEAKKVVYGMDNDFGVAISSVSACGCKESRPSHVLLSMGYNEENAKSSIRITMSINTTEHEVDILIASLKKTISDLRGERYDENK